MTNVTSCITIDYEHKKFIDEKKLNLSALIRDKINEIIKIEDPELFQEKIGSFVKEDKKTDGTVWQRQLNSEPDFTERKHIVFEFLDSIGIDTTNWKERK